MGATKTASQADKPSDILSRVHDGGIKRNSKPKGSKTGKRVNDLTRLEHGDEVTRSEINVSNKSVNKNVKGFDDEEEIYIITKDSSSASLGPYSQIIEVCHSPEEAHDTVCWHIEFQCLGDDSEKTRKAIESNGAVRIEVDGYQDS